jgi:hypothetical protein
MEFYFWPHPYETEKGSPPKRLKVGTKACKGTRQNARDGGFVEDPEDLSRAEGFAEGTEEIYTKEPQSVDSIHLS